jgi:osmotically-inducible protein OsmY
MRKKDWNHLALLAVIGAPLLLQGCAAVVIGGAAVGGALVHDRRTSGTVIDDQGVELKALDLLYSDPAIHEHSNIQITSYNLVVLLTGEAETSTISKKFSKMVGGITGVKRVVNEIHVAPSASIGQVSNDSMLTIRAKIALFDIDEEGFNPSRVKVVTSQGTVYLMGLVTQNEADAVVEVIRNLDGVKRVVKVFEYVQPSS